jgi:hypothetical protein
VKLVALPRNQIKPGKSGGCACIAGLFRLEVISSRGGALGSKGSQ